MVEVNERNRISRSFPPGPRFNRVSRGKSRGKISLMMVGWLFHALAGQDPSLFSRAQEQKPPAAVTLRSELVTIAVAVVDKEGRPVTGLTAKDFEISDNDQPRPVAVFSIESDENSITRPISLVLVVDSSGSVAATVGQQHSAARSLITSLGDRTKIAVVGFSGAPHALIELTTDKQRALEAFTRINPAGRATAILDAILYGLGLLAKDNDASSQKLVVVLSDGLDTASRTESEPCIRLADEIGAAVFGVQIAIFSPREGRLEPRPPSRAWLRVIDATGGRFWRIGEAQQAIDPRFKVDLSPVFLDLLRELQSQYLLGFYPSDSALPGYHALKVRVKKPGMKRVRHRLGYFRVAS